MGCGVVEFATTSDALNAIATMSESTLDGCLVQARADRKPTESDSVGKETAAVAVAVVTTGGSKAGSSQRV